MASSRAWYNKYVKCFCTRNATIQLGWKMYGYGNILIGIPLFLLVLSILPFSITAKDYPSAIFLLAVLCVFICTYLIGYFVIKHEMEKDNHTPSCVRKVSIIGSFFYGIYSDFKIIDKEKGEINGTTSPK